MVVPVETLSALSATISPSTYKFPPTYKSFSIPTPPWVTIDPVSLLIDWVVSVTLNLSSIRVVPLLEFKIRFPTVVSILLSYILTLSNVPTPVTFKLLTLTCVSKVDIPLTFKRLSVVD